MSFQSSTLFRTGSHSKHQTRACGVAAGSGLAAFLLVASSASAQWSVTNLHPGTQGDSYANAVWGTEQGGQISPGGFFPRAAIWSGTAASHVDLHPDGARDSLIVSTNGTQQVGFAFFDSDMTTQASLWSGTAASWTSLHPTGSVESYARSIAGSQQAGYADFDTVRHASLWTGTSGSWVDLHPANASRSDANATSGTQQVGFAEIGGVSRASLWSGTAANAGGMGDHRGRVARGYVDRLGGVVGRHASRQFVLVAGERRLWHAAGRGSHHRWQLPRKPVERNRGVVGRSALLASGLLAVLVRAGHLERRHHDPHRRVWLQSRYGPA